MENGHLFFTDGDRGAPKRMLRPCLGLGSHTPAGDREAAGRAGEMGDRGGLGHKPAGFAMVRDAAAGEDGLRWAVEEGDQASIGAARQNVAMPQVLANAQEIADSGACTCGIQFPPMGLVRMR